MIYELVDDSGLSGEGKCGSPGKSEDVFYEVHYCKCDNWVSVK